ncbi:hypothetical protein D2V17_20635 [Aurantiacibacter xanthus]|uniref:Uncharacterized protein n=1 Tax=Aurantiacibacter xanthus TaxID=1784712 RepID=A0A3A1P0N1_9SPHN|nr:hypothetical protein D2V17_20635 [Aurantiacibacter xanthus]
MKLVAEVRQTSLRDQKALPILYWPAHLIPFYLVADIIGNICAPQGINDLRVFKNYESVYAIEIISANIISKISCLAGGTGTWNKRKKRYQQYNN